MPVMFNDEVVIKYSNRYYKPKVIYDIRDIIKTLVSTKVETIQVCKVTGTFNEMDFGRLQTISLLSETVGEEIGRYHFVETSVNVAWNSTCIVDGNSSISLTDILEKISIIKGAVEVT